MKKVKNFRKFRKARIWSNECLRKYADNFGGDICNVSGANDDDKEGHKYHDYFKNATSYTITNYSGHRGYTGKNGEIFLDLEGNLPSELEKSFDVIFNHTVLEHIYNIERAFSNISAMAKDAVIIVVPWMQEVHISDSYKDYWRFSPYAMEALFIKNGFRMIVCDYNNNFDTAVYLFCIGIRNEQLEKYPNFSPIILSNDLPAGRWMGNDCRLNFFIKG